MFQRDRCTFDVTVINLLVFWGRKISIIWSHSENCKHNTSDIISAIYPELQYWHWTRNSVWLEQKWKHLSPLKHFIFKQVARDNVRENKVSNDFTLIFPTVATWRLLSLLCWGEILVNFFFLESKSEYQAKCRWSRSFPSVKLSSKSPIRRCKFALAT